MPTFTRSVSNLDAEDADGLTAVAHTAHWRVTCKEDPSISAYGTERLGSPDPENFKPLASVTEANVKTWLGKDFWAEIENRLSKQYAEKQSSTAITKSF